ncbi:hypothetical protein NMD31_01370 [Escherichia coli]
MIYRELNRALAVL